MKTYNVRDWYWTIGGDQTKVFSSKVGDYVLVSNPTYLAWASDGSVPTKIDTEANLGEVLAPEQVRPVTSGVLDGYTSKLADNAVTAMTFKILFNHENRIRTLAGQPQVTVQQFRNAIKALM